MDRNDVPAVDPNTGLFYDSAASYWTAGVDGNDVKLGGAAQNLPDPAVRNVYTNITANNDLTGFPSVCHVWSIPVPRRLQVISYQGSPKGLSTPRERISGYRAPLTPRLARPRPIKVYQSTSVLSFNSLPTLKKGSFLGETSMTSPVLGFLPL